MWIAFIPLNLCLVTTKIAILFFYRRIFTTKTFKRCVDVLMAILVLWALANVVVSTDSGLSKTVFRD